MALAAYSQYLEERFQQFPVSDVVTIDLSDFGMETVVSVLNFVYTTEVVIDKQSVGEQKNQHFDIIIINL